MSIIFGIINRNGDDITAQVHYTMDKLHHSSYDRSWLVNNKSITPWNSDFGPVYHQAFVKISFSTKETSDAPAFDCSGNLAVIYEGNLYNSRQLRSDLKKSHNIHAGSASEIVAHLLEDRYQGDLIAAVKQVVPNLDGAYFLAVSDGTQTVILRDMAGLRPAFYAENNKTIAFASLKKILWDMGFRDVKPLRAGVLASLDKNGICFENMYSLQRGVAEAEIHDMSTAVDAYCNLIDDAVRKRISNLNKVGVLMSGGVDSCLMAKLVTDTAAEGAMQVIAYTAGVNGTYDIEYAEQFAKELGIKHRIRRISVGEIESYIPKVACAVEERDMVQIEAGIGIYAALEMASQDGIQEVISGQGPDELWGGYDWYPKVIAAEGHKGLHKRMWDDLERSDIETFDRENKIALANNAEQLFPYCDNEIINLAAGVSPQLKVKSADDNVGKHPHREAAIKLGLSHEFAYRAKNAAQHGTGIHENLDGISRKNGFTPELVSRVNYSPEEVSKERLASSTRYGYRYANRELWQVPSHVQFFLDSVAYDCGLLNQNERVTISRFLQEAGLQ